MRSMREKNHASKTYNRLGISLGMGLRLTRQLEVGPILSLDVITQDLPEAIPVYDLGAGLSVLWRFQ